MRLAVLLRDMMRRRHLPSPSRRDSQALPGLGLEGHRGPAARLAAPRPGRTVLDLGCAEGLMLRPLLGAGAASGHGLDNSAPGRIASARFLYDGVPPVSPWPGSAALPGSPPRPSLAPPMTAGSSWASSSASCRAAATPPSTRHSPGAVTSSPSACPTAARKSLRR